MDVPNIREHLRWRGGWIVFVLSLRELLRPLLYWHVWHIYETDLSGEITGSSTRPSMSTLSSGASPELSALSRA